MFKTSLLTAAVAALAIAGASSADILLDENFQTPLSADGTALVGTIAGWTGHATNVKLRLQSSNLAPGDTDYATNQVANLEWNGSSFFEHDLSHNWSSTDVFQVSFNAMSIAWNINTQRWVLPKLIETGSGDVLWEAPQDANSELFWHDVNTEGPNPWAWNGPGPYGNSTWQAADPADTFFSFTVNAADFVTGTEGSNIKLQMNSAGTRGVTFDNIVVEVVPEPGSLALLGLGGLLMASRRRRACE